MTPETLTLTRQSYLTKLGYDPTKIPGRAILRGEYDTAPAFREHEAELLRNRKEADEG